MAEEEARMMRVEPEKLTQILLMGYTAIEARRGLRSSQGNIDQAVEFIIEVITNFWTIVRKRITLFRIVACEKNVDVRKKLEK